MKTLFGKIVVLSCLLMSPRAHAAFCGADGFLHGWIGPYQVPCNPHGGSPGGPAAIPAHPISASIKK